MHVLKALIRGDDFNQIEALDSPDTLVLALAARQTLTPDLVQNLRASMPQSKLIGCSSSGHFVGPDLTDDGLAVAVARMERTRLRSAVAPLGHLERSFEAGEKLAAELNGHDLRAVLVLSEGSNCNGTELVAGLLSILSPDTVVFGGLAGDGDRFEETSVLIDDRLGQGMVAAVGFYGHDFTIETATGGGWELFGPERTITSAEGSVLRGLDDELALDLYRRYLGEQADELPGSALLFPLALRAPGAPAEHLVVRTVLGIDSDEKTMTFAGDIPQGWRAQLMRASFDNLVDGAEAAAEKIGSGNDGIGDSLCLGISCVGRRLVLGTRCEDELDAVSESLGDMPFVGFYSYGELGPGLSGACELHNQTMTLAVLGETDRGEPRHP